MKAYSLNFREKIVDTYFKAGSSQRKIAKRFGVALSFFNETIARLHRQLTPAKLN